MTWAEVSRSHSPEDVKLVTSILAATPGYLPSPLFIRCLLIVFKGASELLIMDARPLVNARANAVMGAGYLSFLSSLHAFPTLVA